MIIKDIWTNFHGDTLIYLWNLKMYFASKIGPSPDDLIFNK